MKKYLALFLSLLMVFALFGCDTNNNTAEETTSAPTATATDTGTTDATTVGEGMSFVYLCGSMTFPFCQAVAARFQEYADEVGATMIIGSSDFDNEEMIRLVETYAQQVDGMFVNSGAELSNSIMDIANEAGVPLLSESTNLIDATTGELLTAGVELNAYDCGYKCSQWICENYEDLGYDASNMDTLGFIVASYSAVISFNDRAQGALDRFAETFPDCENIYIADALNQGAVTAEAALTETAAILAAHPEIETWFIVGILDDFAQGAVRAIEAAGLEDQTLVTSVGGEVLVQEWESGYEGCWKACALFTGADFSDQLWPAMMSVISGEKTVEELWPDWKAEGENYGVYKVTGVNTDRETYLASAA